MLGIIIVVIGFVVFVYGLLALFGRLKMKENDRVSRFYVGIQGAAGGLTAIFLGFVLYFYW